MVFYREGGTDTVTPTCTPTALYRDAALTQVVYPNGLSTVARWGYIGGDATVSEILPTLVVQMLLPTAYYAEASCFARV